MRRSPRPLVVGNWKMNGLMAELEEVKSVARALETSPASCDVVICPPFTLLRPMKELLTATELGIGGQDCHIFSQGAHTGDVSAEMLKDAGASAVIVGHSERRETHRETDSDVRAKADAAHRAGLTAIICVGETLEQRESGETLRIVGRRLRDSMPTSATARNTAIAYEPIWAIGTGTTPEAEDVAAVHAALRGNLKELVSEDSEQVRIMYGGSVKRTNAAGFLAVPNIDGVLVGGASLKARDFLPIVRACD